MPTAASEQMAYSPVYRGIWNHEDLEGAPFEEIAFFVFLWSNDFIRPSGIYRASDDQLMACSRLPVDRVRKYLIDLSNRVRIVRDGAWIFVRGYLARQPKQQNLLRGVKADIDSCSSVPILNSFSLKYPLYSQWSADRLATIGHTMNGSGPAVAVAVADKDLNLAGYTTTSERGAKRRAKVLDFHPTPTLQDSDRVIHPIRYVLTRFDLAFLAKVGDRHPPFSGKDAKLAERMLKSFGVEKVARLIDAFFELDDAWIRDSGYGFAIFHSQLAKLLVKLSSLVPSSDPYAKFPGA